MIVLTYWLIRGALAGESFGDFGEPLINSIIAASLASAALTAIALPLAIFIVRYPGKLAWAVERSAYIGFALPGITVAIALVFLGVHLLYPIYQTLLLLVIAYVLLFLPATLGPLRSGILQLNPRVEEAARTLGKTQRQVLLQITIPLVRGSLLAGFAMAFLLTMKELPATLVLGPLDFRTLATATWAATSESFFASASASALLLILVGSIPLIILLIAWDSRKAPIATFDHNPV
jgi:iron(III) transport system permease protein